MLTGGTSALPAVRDVFAKFDTLADAQLADTAVGLGAALFSLVRAPCVKAGLADVAREAMQSATAALSAADCKREAAVASSREDDIRRTREDAAKATEVVEEAAERLAQAEKVAEAAAPPPPSTVMEVKGVCNTAIGLRTSTGGDKRRDDALWGTTRSLEGDRGTGHSRAPAALD